jgi:cytochrome c553
LFNLPLETEPKMKTTTQLLMGSLLAVAAAAAQAEVTQVKVWAAACANCHGTNGQSQPGMESLAGKDKAELAQKMLDFKAGRKPATIMHQLSKGYTDEQIQQLAAHFAALPKKQ